MRRLLCISTLCVMLTASGAAAHAAVGFRVVQIPGGPKMAVWFPAAEKESPHAYGRSASGSVALNAPPAHSERYPLLLFSHGWGGCGTQSVFLTETLARAGYLIAAPDHHDAGCGVEGRKLPRIHFPQMPFTTPARWHDSSYQDRRADLEKALDWMLESADFRGAVDSSRIGAVGHSLGGYSVLGLAGAWESWKDSRIGAVLALSPYVKPFLLHERLRSVDVPVMYQGAQLDLGITPSLRGSSGAFAQSEEPKYYVELHGGSHFDWTNAECLGHGRIEDCLQKRANARLIADYSRAFFDCYLKQRPEALNRLDGTGLRAYRHSELQ